LRKRPHASLELLGVRSEGGVQQPAPTARWADPGTGRERPLMPLDVRATDWSVDGSDAGTDSEPTVA
jgi:hypothetical protein